MPERNLPRSLILLSSIAEANEILKLKPVELVDRVCEGSFGLEYVAYELWRTGRAEDWFNLAKVLKDQDMLNDYLPNVSFDFTAAHLYKKGLSNQDVCEFLDDTLVSLIKVIDGTGFDEDLTMRQEMIKDRILEINMENAASIFLELTLNNTQKRRMDMYPWN